ncbi:hypothetical protein JHK87_000845 [Glycine soja]|nr:hypothetical protein JHK87_000845 [Glycine soja]
MESDNSSNTGDNIASQEEDATVATIGVHQPNKEVQLVSKTKRRIVRPTEVEDFARRLNSDWPERMQILSLGQDRRLVTISMNSNGSTQLYTDATFNITTNTNATQVSWACKRQNIFKLFSKLQA